MKLETMPITDGFIIPAEWEPHAGCLMIWPEIIPESVVNITDIQKNYSQIANTIAKYEPVTMFISKKQIKNAKKLLNPKINLVMQKFYKTWARNIGPTFLKNSRGEIRGINWTFNFMGAVTKKIRIPKNYKFEIAENACQIRGYDFYQTNFVLEGGSIQTDGQGTIFTTEECLLNKNHNPHLSKEELTNNLISYLGAKKVIWLPYGVINDATDGHVNNLLRVIAPGHVALTWTDDMNDPQYERSLAALKVLKATTDAYNRKIKVTKIHQPQPVLMTLEEFNRTAKKIKNYPIKKRNPVNLRLPASYLNFYIANGAIIMPIFGDDKFDQQAIEALKELFPDHVVEAIMTRDILMSGGNIHCLTQQEPL